MNALKKIFLLVFCLLNLLNTHFLTAQSIEEKIASIPEKYFELDREVFHLQFNKSVYINSETIWFKGFVFDKKNNVPNLETTNVYVSLYSSTGEQLNSKLCYARNGSFQGDFIMKSDYPAGKYYVQVNTNWSNNFEENESGIFTFIILDSNEKTNSKSSNPTLTFHPEGGLFLEGITNTIGVSILDCNDNGIEINDGVVLNNNGEVIANFQTNNFGFGKFDIIETGHEIYKIVFNYKNRKIEKVMPYPKELGTALTVNNFSNETKTFVTIKTNDKTRKDLEGKNLYLTVNQNEKMVIAGFQLKENSNQIILSNTDLFDGVNIIRVIDDNLNSRNERIIYKPFANEFDIQFEVSKKTIDSIEIKGFSNVSNIRIGVSVLPEKSLSTKKEQNIISSLNINSYLKNPTLNINSIFENPSKKNNFYLDLILMNESESKYDWEKMKNPPTIKYKFNKGVTLKGTINEAIDNKKNYTIQMFSLPAELNEFAEIDEKNEFYFRNFIALDSTKVNFTLVKNGEKYKELIFLPKVVNEDTPFLKPFEIKKQNCEWIQEQNTNNTPELALPKIKEAIELKDIVVISEPKKVELKNQLKFGNSMMKGYKINNDEYNMYTNVISFIAGHGFDAGSQAGNVYIRGRARISITRPNIPSVFLDDIEITDFNILDNMSLKLVSEIYINKNGTTIQSKGTGVIKIYSNLEYKNKPRKSLAKSFVITNAFANETIFKNPPYESYLSEGFQNYGTLFWEPNIETEGNMIQLFIPNLKQKNITLQIEGISSEGKLISTTKVINLE